MSVTLYRGEKPPRTVCCAVEEPGVVREVLKLLRAVRNFVVRIRRRGVANEDARNLVGELLRDLRIGGEEGRRGRVADEH